MECGVCFNRINRDEPRKYRIDNIQSNIRPFLEANGLNISQTHACRRCYDKCRRFLSLRNELAQLNQNQSPQLVDIADSIEITDGEQNKITVAVQLGDEETLGPYPMEIDSDGVKPTKTETKVVVDITYPGSRKVKVLSSERSNVGMYLARGTNKQVKTQLFYEQ